MNQKLSRSARQRKVLKRIAVVREALVTLEGYQALLNQAARGKICLSNGRIYQQTPEDQARRPRTLANLESQCVLLRCELGVLLEYALDGQDLVGEDDAR